MDTTHINTDTTHILIETQQAHPYRLNRHNHRDTTHTPIRTQHIYTYGYKFRDLLVIEFVLIFFLSCFPVFEKADAYVNVCIGLYVDQNEE